MSALSLLPGLIGFGAVVLFVAVMLAGYERIKI